MSDLRDVLDRKARQYRPSEDASFEKLIDRAERRHRNRRITSGVVALAVAIAGSLGAYGMLTGGAKTGPGASSYTGIWPQTTIEEAQIAQARANQGDDDDFSHQQDAFEFVHTFAKDALWWFNVRVDPIPAAEAAGSGPLTATATGCTEEQLNTETDVLFCPDEAMQTVEVTIERLVQRDPKGIWIVTAATIDGAQPSMHPSPMPPTDSPGAPGPEDTTAAAVPSNVEAFVEAFIQSRAEETVYAEEQLAWEALAAYDSNEGGLELYDYESDAGVSWEIATIEGLPNTDRWRVVLRIEGQGGDFPASGTIHETLLVGSPGDGAPLKVLTAERNE
jgi:hypothetical protein